MDRHRRGGVRTEVVTAAQEPRGPGARPLKSPREGTG